MTGLGLLTAMLLTTSAPEQTAPEPELIDPFAQRTLAPARTPAPPPELIDPFRVRASGPPAPPVDAESKPKEAARRDPFAASPSLRAELIDPFAARCVRPGATVVSELVDPFSPKEGR